MYANDAGVLLSQNNTDGSKWFIEKNNEGYILKYINAEGRDYSNDLIITSDIESSALFLDVGLDGVASLTMNYPRDKYIFKFTSGNTPNFISSCKQITLPAVVKQQVITLLTLCSKNKSDGLMLSNIDTNEIFSPDNLRLESKVTVAIGSEKAFLYSEDKKQNQNKPYLIRGGVVEVLEYKNSMLKVKYTSKNNREIITWIKFIDIL